MKNKLNLYSILKRTKVIIVSPVFTIFTLDKYFLEALKVDKKDDLVPHQPANDGSIDGGS